MSKRYVILALALAVVAIVAMPSMALANFAIHGGYTQDTDACAGCHRAHTSASSLQWADDGGIDHSALLVSTADKMYEFCYACHDGAAQGADTDVQNGIYDGSLYGSTDATLNGGGFEDLGANGHTVTSDHMYTGAYWGAYGGGAYGMGATGANGLPITGIIRPGAQMANVGESNEKIKMDCTACHDPHGSSNYRILKDQVYGNAVGGYDGAGTPQPYVLSSEVGFPTTATIGYNGFKLQTQYPGYQPNYTTPLYSKGPAGDKDKGMTGWCVGCHAVYATKTSTYDAGDGQGLAARHRHPMNSELSNFDGPRSLIVTDLPLPLAHDPSEAGSVDNESSDWIECLTCHYAHGSSADMTGFANVADVNQPEPNSGTSIVVVDGKTIVKKGVAPTGDSALLRRNNRGVCEVCHNQ